MINHLYIIGNGFDLHHEIPSNYKNFREWLNGYKNTVGNYPFKAVVMRLDDIYGADDVWWWNFENSLGKFDFHRYIDELKTERYPDIASDDFRDRDRFVMPDSAQYELSSLYNEMRKAFHEWVKNLPQGKGSKKIHMETQNAFFINFNYTETLQRLYNVSENEIYHIHGKAGRDEPLILGHGRSYKDLEQETTDNPPISITDPNEIQAWYDAHYDPILDETTKCVLDQVAAQRKDVNSILHSAPCRQALNQIKNVSDIHIYGLSFSPVDLPYLKTIVANVNILKTRWEISYFSDDDKQRADTFLQKYGIHGNLVNLDDLLLLQQGTLFP